MLGKAARDRGQAWQFVICGKWGIGESTVGNRPRVFKFFRQDRPLHSGRSLQYGSLLSVPRARGICRTGMTCQKESKRLGDPIGNEQRATCVAASKGIGHIALSDDR